MINYCYVQDLSSTALSATLISTGGGFPNFSDDVPCFSSVHWYTCPSCSLDAWLLFRCIWNNSVVAIHINCSPILGTPFPHCNPTDLPFLEQAYPVSEKMYWVTKPHRCRHLHMTADDSVLNAAILNKSYETNPRWMQKNKFFFPWKFLPMDWTMFVLEQASSIEAHLSGSIVLLASMRAKKTGTIAAHRCLRVWPLTIWWVQL
jgi:hypothetical protein